MKTNIYKVIAFALILTTGAVLAGAFVNISYSAFNPEINYQGKLTDSNNLAVSDGTYHMKFRLYDAESGGNLLWEGDRSTNAGDRVTVTDGLFSVMLGSSTPLTSVDFNQTLYLEVAIGGTDGLSFETLTPRKVVGAVPAAFEAGKLDGIDSLSFLRSDEPDTMASSSVSTLFTINQSGTGDILNLQDGGSEVLTVLDGGNVGIGTTSPGAKLHVAGNALIDERLDINGAGDADLQIESQLTSHPAARTAIYTSGSGGSYPFDNIGNLILKPRTNTGANGRDILFVTGNSEENNVVIKGDGNVGIGTTSPTTLLTVGSSTPTSIPAGNYYNSAFVSGDLEIGGTFYGDVNGTIDPNFTAGSIAFASSSGALTQDNSNFFWDDTNNRLGIGTTSPDGTLHAHTATAGGVTANSVADDLIVENSGAGGISVLVPDSDVARLAFGSPSDNIGAQLFWNYNDAVLDIGTSKAGGEIALNTAANSEAVRIDAQGNVGIGTTSPSEKLEVAGGGILISNTDNPAELLLRDSRANTNAEISQRSDGRISLTTRSGNYGSNGIEILDSGNVGIGTVSPGDNLEINSSVATDVAIVSDSDNNSADTNAFLKFFVDGGPSTGGVLKTTIGYDEGDDVARFGYSSGANLVIDSGGNVGIGTVSPGAKLEVAGDFIVSDGTNDWLTIASNGSLIFDNTDPGEGDVQWNIDFNNDFNIDLDGNSSGNFEITQGGTNSRFIVQGTGNVGIGTNNPSALLDVSSTSEAITRLSNSNTGLVTDDVVGSLEFYSADGSGDGAGVKSKISSISENSTGAQVGLGFFTEYTTDGLSEKMRIDAQGNVGIGTTSPTARLHIDNVGTNSDGLLLENGVGTQVLRILNENGDSTIEGYLNNDLIIRTLANSNDEGIKFQDSDSNTRMFISNNGNVGIGETAPGSKLAVSGNATIGASYDTVTAPPSGLLVEGNVGIGTTSPSAKLTVYGNTLLEGTDRYLNFGSATSSAGYGIRDNTGAMEFKDSGGSWTALSTLGGSSLWTESGSDIYYDTGNVGIGTVSPGAPLHVVSSANAGFSDNSGSLRLDRNTNNSIQLNSNSSALGQIRFGDENSSYAGALEYSHSDDYLHLVANGQRKVTVDSAGNVGIGTTSPSVALDVNGAGNFADDVTVGNILLDHSRNAFLIDATVGTPVDIKRQTSSNVGMFFTGYGDIGSIAPNVSFRRGRGTETASDVVSSGDNLGEFRFFGHDNSAEGSGGFTHVTAKIIGFATESYTASAQGSGISFETTDNGGTTRTEKLRIGNTGNVLIGGTAEGASAEKALHIFNGTAPTGSVTDGVILYSEDVSSSAELKVRDEAGWLGTLSGNVVLNEGGGDFDFRVEGDTEPNLLFVDAGNDNVGIGTSSPSAKLTVYGNTLLEGSNRYLNFGTTEGSTGYGVRDNAGAMEFKDSGGSWTAFNTLGGGGSSLWTESGSDIYYDSGNVGIGTSTPASKLDVWGDFRVGTSSTPALFTDTSNGRVGLGTASPEDLLDIRGTNNGGDVSLRIMNSGSTGIGSTAETNEIQFYFPQGLAPTSAGKIVAGKETSYQVAGAESSFMAFYTLSSSAGHTEKLRIKADGKIGINTTGPDRKLDILDASSPQLRLTQSDGTVYTDFQTTSGGDLTISPTGGDASLAGNFLPTLDDTYALGSATSRWSDLYVGSSTIHVGQSLTDEGTISYDTSSNIFNFGTDSTSNGDIAFNTDDLYINKSTSRVGIGTANPATKFVIQQDSGTLISRVENTSSTGRSIFEVRGNSAYFDMRAHGTSYSETLFGTPVADTSMIMGRQGKLLIGTYESEDFILGTSNNERLRILNSGNIGINTSGPDRKLDILDASSPQLRLTQSDGTVYTDLQTTSSGHLYINPSGGNVGIGTSSPSNTLVVSGTGKFTGAVTLDSTLNTHTIPGGTGTLALTSDVVSDHGGLSGLTDDDHSQYALLAGRSGGQTLIGGTGASETLTLQSTSNATKGKILFGDSAYDEVNNRLGISTTSPSAKLHVYNGSSGASTFNGDLVVENNLGASIQLVTPSTRGASIYFGDENDSTTGSIVYSNSTDVLSFHTDNDTRMSIGPNGNVGIGETAPGSKLAVSGNATIGASYDTVTAPPSGLLVEGNVGIGTTSPSAKLSVYGNTLLEGTGRYLNFGTTEGSTGYGVRDNAGAMEFKDSGGSWTAFNTLGGGGSSLWTQSGSDIYYNSGNVGIGTTSPGANLEIASTNARLRLNETDGSIFQLTSNTNKFFIADITNAGALPFQIEANAPTDSLYIKATSGNVGIGTSSPASKLDVWGNVLVSGSGTGYYATNSGAGAVKLLYIDDTNAEGNGTNGVYLSTSGGSDDLRFKAGGSTRMSILDTGNVGIGALSPGKKLEVQDTSAGGVLVYDSSTSNAAPLIEVRGRRGDGNASQSFSGGTALAGLRTDAAVASGKKLGTVYFGGNHTNGTESNLLYSASISGISEGTFNSSGDMPTGIGFFTGSSGTALGTANQDYGAERMRIDADGNVGIGTDNPTHNLHITGTSNQSLRIQSTGASSVADVQLQNDGNYWRWGVFSALGDAMALNDITGGGFPIQVEPGSPSSTLHLDSGGNVGIGTASPDEALSIVGSGSWPIGITTVDTINRGANAADDGLITVDGDMLLQVDDNNNQVSNFIFYNGGEGEIARLTEDGKLGIGTNAPSGRIDVISSSYTDGYRLNGKAALTNNTSDGWLRLNQSQSFGNGVYTPSLIRSDGGFQVGAGGANFIVQGDGDVGIGTSSPDYNLDVEGSSPSIRVNGTDTNGFSRLFLTTLDRDWRIVNDPSDKLFFYDGTAAATRLAIDTSGNVGIGTISPTAKLEIKSDTYNDFLVMDRTGASGVDQKIYLTPSFSGADTTQLRINIGSGNPVLVVAENGNVGIGITLPDHRLDIGDGAIELGDVYFRSMGAYGSDTMCWDGSGASFIGDCISSIEYKENVTELSMDLDTINNLKPREFDWKDDGEHDLGFIAEEVAEVNPLLATYRDGEIRGVKYRHMVALAVKGIQELDLKVTDLEKFVGKTEELTEGKTLWDVFMGKFADMGIKFLSGSIVVKNELCIEEVCINKGQLKKVIASVNETGTTDTTSADTDDGPNVYYGTTTEDGINRIDETDSNQETPSELADPETDPTSDGAGTTTESAEAADSTDDSTDVSTSTEETSTETSNPLETTNPEEDSVSNGAGDGTSTTTEEFTETDPVTDDGSSEETAVSDGTSANTGTGGDADGEVNTSTSTTTTTETTSTTTETSS